MDLKEFYFQNIKESEYHYRFLDSVKKVNYTYNIFTGEEETQNYQFEIYDAEEAITKFKELCQPEVYFSVENRCWFYKPFLKVPKQLSHSLAIWAIYAHAHIAPPVAKFVSLIIEIELLSC